MPCYYPITAWYSIETNPETGKRPLTWSASKACVDLPQVQVACGQCIGCRLERSRQWAIRCVHEAQLHSENSFITLTFDDEHLNKSGTLVKADFQKFMKRLRKKTGKKIRYFHCGEYGDKFKRPHHHACLFGYDFPDKKLWQVRDEVRLYRSAELESLWTDPKSGQALGYCTIGDVTFESAAYVARYCTKKINGKRAVAHYGGREPEYVTMSRRPGIGKDWFKKFKDDVYPQDYMVIRGGKKCRPAKYYDRNYELTDPQQYAKIKNQRQRKAIDNPENNYLRRKVKAELAHNRAAQLKRGYETGDTQ